MHGRENVKGNAKKIKKEKKKTSGATLIQISDYIYSCKVDTVNKQSYRVCRYSEHCGECWYARRSVCWYCHDVDLMSSLLC